MTSNEIKQPKTPHEEIMLVVESNNEMLSKMMEWAEKAKEAFDKAIELMKKDIEKKGKK